MWPSNSTRRPLCIPLHSSSGSRRSAHHVNGVTVDSAQLHMSTHAAHASDALPAAALAGLKLEQDRRLATLPAINALKKLCCHPDMVGA